jgi:hypothetical protein
MAPRGLERLGIAGKGSAVPRSSSQALSSVPTRRHPVRQLSAAEATSDGMSYPTPGCRLTAEGLPGRASLLCAKSVAKAGRSQDAYAQAAMFLTNLRKWHRMTRNSRRITK